MNTTDMMERIAKNVGVSIEALRAKMNAVLADNQATWEAQGKDAQTCEVNALRIAGRQLKSEADKLSRSGATLYEGMFIYVPRPKDWADMAYKKAATTVSSAPDTVIEQMVESGKITLYLDNNDGTFTKRYNPSLAQKADFSPGTAEVELSALPKDTYDAGMGMHFHLIWDSANPKYPSGDANWKYGKARPLNEPERTCLFLGRKRGDTEVTAFSFRLSGSLANEQFPTFVTGTIAMKPARNGDVAYGKAGVTAFSRDDSVQSIFSAPPQQLVGEHLKLLSGLSEVEGFMATLDDKTKWDAKVAINTEVVHIDPRDNGGFIVTVGDLDIFSSAPTVDVYVPAEQEDLVTFGVGSNLLIVGAPWMSREGEARLSVAGFFCPDEPMPTVSESSSDEGDMGWD